jgi:hypothetical protein
MIVWMTRHGAETRSQANGRKVTLPQANPGSRDDLLKSNADPVRPAPSDAALTGQLIAVDDEIEFCRDALLTSDLQARSVHREVPNDAVEHGDAAEADLRSLERPCPRFRSSLRHAS